MYTHFFRQSIQGPWGVSEETAVGLWREPLATKKSVTPSGLSGENFRSDSSFKALYQLAECMNGSVQNHVIVDDRHESSIND